MKLKKHMMPWSRLVKIGVTISDEILQNRKVKEGFPEHYQKLIDKFHSSTQVKKEAVVKVGLSILLKLTQKARFPDY